MTTLMRESLGFVAMLCVGVAATVVEHSQTERNARTASLDPPHPPAVEVLDGR